MEERRVGRLSAGAWAWALFEGTRNPYVVLVTIYVFMPYFSSVVVGDPVRGQQAVATYGQWSGLIIALTAPLLGAAVDRLGRRKPALAAVTALMIPLIWSLWFTRPDHRGLSVPEVIAIATAINVLFAYSEVLHNAMLVRAAGPTRTHSASGLALFFGNLISVSVLIFVLVAFVLPAAAPGFPIHQPLFGLDARLHEPSRIVAPICAVLLLLGIGPLLLLAPDSPPTGLKAGEAVSGAARALLLMLRGLGGQRDAAAFLLSRMLYVDAMTAVLLFAGVYAAGVMGWGAAQLLAYGVLLSVLAAAGGLLASVVDGALGPKRAVQIEIGVTLAGLIAIIGTGHNRILYLWASSPRPIWPSPIFNTAAEVFYLGVAACVSVAITASYASSRTLLTRLAPADATGAFFGLYALSGTATVWLGSALVLIATRVTHTQQAGMAALAVLMSLGFAGLFFVRTGADRASAAP